MTFLPIVDRELRRASRLSGTYWSRSQTAFLALVPTSFMLIMPAGGVTPASQGTGIFQVLAWIAFLYTILAGVRLTADSLSSEKRDGTLGFLFLTDLKPHDVILGKLAGTSLTVLYSVLALLPVLAIPILMGGVNMADLFRLALVLLNTLFFTLSLSIFVSAGCWEERKAVGVTTILLIGFTAGLPLVGNIVSELNGSNSSASLLSVLSPGHACSRIATGPYDVSPAAFWVSTISTHGLGWLFLGLACFVLPRVWQDRPAEKRRLRWREWCRRILMGSLPARTEFRRRLLDINPIYWIASRERRTIWYPWILLSSFGALITIGCWQIRGIDLSVLLFVSVLLNWLFKHWISGVSCHAFASDRDKGALELLLSTPLNVHDMTKGHWLAMRRQFLAPISTLIAVELVLFGVSFLSDSPQSRESIALYVTAFIVTLVVFVADLAALVWVGWWAGAVSKNASSAGTTTYIRIMILPWIVTLSIMIFISLYYTLLFNDNLLFGLCIYAVASLTADGLFAFRARRKLYSDLRNAAVERYSGGDPAMIWWRQLGRTLARWSNRSKQTGNRAR